MKSEPLYYIARAEGNVAGPYDLVQMAGLLRKSIITAETSTRLEGEEEWRPLGEQSSYCIILEIPADAVSMRIATLDEEAAAPSGAIPLPSGETLMKLGAVSVVFLIVAGLSFMIAKTDPPVGHMLTFLGAGIALVAQCLIMARLLDEDFTTLAMMVLIPFYDIFYFLTNIWEYFPYFCVKYGGMIMAAAGLAANPSH